MRNWILGLVTTTMVTIICLIMGLLHMRIDWLQAIFLVFTLYGMFLIFIAAIQKPRSFIIDENYMPYVSMIIPARNEEKVIARTVRSLMKADYHIDGVPQFEVIVMDDNSSDNTLSEARSLLNEFPNLKVVHRGPDVAGKGKSDVLNQGVREARGELIGVFDADTDISPDFLKKSIPMLADPTVGGVQGRVRLYNREKNYLTRLQEDEFAIISHLYQLGKEHVGGLTALGGNGQFVKREALKSVNGWNYLSPTEDLDLTFRFLFKEWHIRYAPDSVLWQEGVETPWAFVRQRVRWAEGFLKCIFDYTLPLLFGKSSFMTKLDGAMTMLRVMVPFYVWIGYFYVIVTLIKDIEFATGISPYIMVASSWVFFAVMIVAMHRILYPKFFEAVYRASLYMIYSSFWIVAVPLGFVNCFRHINDIYWDKTEHKGSSDNRVSVESAAQA